MGIDVHALNFLQHAIKKKRLGDTMTIGRQGLHVTEAEVKEFVMLNPDYRTHPYCEELLIEYFGATKVESIDNSDYEKATHIHNMNSPLPKHLCQSFDTVIDGGCLEHVYNAPQALANCSLLCKPGGQIIHILPANNFCGHGFWQFSPELFFSLYSTKNGYAETEVFLADLSDTSRWFPVQEPKNGKRVNVASSTELYVLVRTVLQTTSFSHSEVQQSDYAYEWEQAAMANPKPATKPGRLKQALKNMPLVYKLLSPPYNRYLRSRIETGLNEKNPGLTMIRVKAHLLSD